MPTAVENSRKTVGKGAAWVAVECLQNSEENKTHPKTQHAENADDCLRISVFGCWGVFGCVLAPAKKQPVTVKTAVFRMFLLLAGCSANTLSGTHLAPFLAVFRLFSAAGTGQLSRCPRRFQCLWGKADPGRDDTPLPRNLHMQGIQVGGVILSPT